MDITGKHKFGLTLFCFISVLFLAYVVVFAFYQSNREREYKKGLAGVRVTVIDTSGVVLFDTEKNPQQMPNHLHRHEVQQALSDGYGFDIDRTSETNGERYFYSATYSPETGQIIRSAVPYPNDKNKSVITNRGYIAFSVLIFLILTLVLYIYTKRIGQHVDTTLQTYRKQVREAEEEKVRIKHQLTQNTAHELKTPAASINAYLETLLSTPDLTAEKRQYFLERCLAQSERMNALLKDMSTLTKLDESGKNAAHFEPIDLVQIVNSAVHDVAQRATMKHIDIQITLPAEMPMQGDRTLLNSVFLNILENAIAYSNADTLIIQAETTTNNPTTYAFTIADNGIGIPKEHLPFIFERFYRVDQGRSRELGGTGLGLAIVKNAITLHGGNITATNTIPHGLTIQFTLTNQQK